MRHVSKKMFIKANYIKHTIQQYTQKYNIDIYTLDRIILIHNDVPYARLYIYNNSI